MVATCHSDSNTAKFAGRVVGFLLVFFFLQYHSLCLSVPTTCHSLAFTKSQGEPFFKMSLPIPRETDEIIPSHRWSAVYTLVEYLSMTSSQGLMAGLLALT